MWKRWQFDLDHVVGPNNTALKYHCHNACFADQLTVWPPVKDRCQQPALKAFDLGAGVAQTCHFQNHTPPDSETSVSRQTEQIDAARTNIFTHVAGFDPKTLLAKLLEQFGMDQMHLPKVRLGGVGCYARAVLNRGPLVCIAFDTKPGKDGDGRNQSFRKAMLHISGYGGHKPFGFVGFQHLAILQEQPARLP